MAERPRVVLATRIFAPEPAAASFRLAALVRGLRRTGADVTVLTTTTPGREEQHVDGARLSRWPVLRDRAGYVRGYVQYMSFDIPLALRLLAVRRPGVVVVEPPPTTGLVAAAVGLLRGVPYVYYAADVWSDAAQAGSPGIVVSVLRAAERLVLRRAAGVVAVSPEVGARAQALGARDVVVVPNGVDTTVFTTDGDDLRDGPPTQRYFLYAGTASEWQGAEVFARAMRRLSQSHPDVRLVFLGQGSAWQEIADVAGSLPEGTIVMHDRVAPEVAASWLRGAVAALVSVRPGAGYDLARPTKVYAALATGCPVIYAGPGQLRDVIGQNAFGWTVDHDEEGVARAMADALDRPRPDPRRARSWVLQNASLLATGERAARVVLDVAAR